MAKKKFTIEIIVDMDTVEAKDWLKPKEYLENEINTALDEIRRFEYKTNKQEYTHTGTLFSTRLSNQKEHYPKQ